MRSRKTSRDAVPSRRPPARDARDPLDALDDDDTGLTPRVLLVDPSGSVLDVVRSHLPADTQISSTESVQRALPRIDNEPFDLVVCDIDAQGMEQLLGGDKRVAFLQGERIVALNGINAPATTATTQPEDHLRRVLASALNVPSTH